MSSANNDIRVVDKGSGLYQIAYIPTSGSSVIVDVKLNSIHAPGFPIKRIVIPSAAVGKKSTVVGGNQLTLFTGAQNVMWILAKDKYGNPLTSGGAGSTISLLVMQGRAGYSAMERDCASSYWKTRGTSLTPAVKDFKNGTYRIIISIPSWKLGNASFCVLFQGEGVENSPLNVTLCVPPVCDRIGDTLTAFGCQPCGSGFYSISRGAPCSECPKFALCHGGSSLLADKYSYQSSLDQSKFHLCNIHDACCPTGSCLGPTWSSGNTSIGTSLGDGNVISVPCSKNRMGILCASCVEGYAEWGGECVPCPSDYVDWGRVFLLLGTYAFLLLFWMNVRRCINVGRSLGVFRIISEYVQNIAFMLVPLTPKFDAVIKLPLMKPDLFALNAGSQPNCMANISPLGKVVTEPQRGNAVLAMAREDRQTQHQCQHAKATPPPPFPPPSPPHQFLQFLSGRRACRHAPLCCIDASSSISYTLACLGVIWLADSQCPFHYKYSMEVVLYRDRCSCLYNSSTSYMHICR
jgi:hypothetical protein